MRVISLINGTLTAQTSSLYAIQYAKKLDYKLVLGYVKEANYPSELDESVGYLQNLCKNHGLKNEFIVFDNLSKLDEYIKNRDVDMLFCSTRHNHSLLDRSFAQTIIKKDMEVDLAITKIVKLCLDNCAERIILPIRGTKLSVKKFSLFSTFALAYGAKAEIYSIDKITDKKFAQLDIEDIKYRLKEIIFNLRHYFRIAKILNFKFNLKHDYAFNEGDWVKSHIAQNGYDLVIVGAHHESSILSNHPIDVLFKNPTINTLYFIPHKEEI